MAVCKQASTHTFQGYSLMLFSSLHITVEESQKEGHSFDNASYDTLVISQMHVIMSLSIADAIA